MANGHGGARPGAGRKKKALSEKLVDGKPQPAFNLTVYGEERQGAERLGKPLGSMVESDIPAFMVELGQTVAASGLDFDSWLAAHEEEFRALADKYAQA